MVMYVQTIDRIEDTMSEIYSRETSSASDFGGGGYDQSLAPTDLLADAWSYKVNMSNCYKHQQNLFNRCKDGMIHRDVLISFWMISGYLSPAESVNEVYKKGSRLLRDLIQGGLLKSLDEDPDMIELAGSICTHGFTPCDEASVGFIEMVNVDKVEEVMLTDGMTKKRNSSPHGNYLCRQVFQSQRGLKYIAHFNPTSNSLNPLLESVKNPSVLMLRGFDDHLFPLRAFTFENFKTLTVLEISGSNILPLYPTISELTQLRYLYLSDPRIKRLPYELFSKLVELRWLILRGCSLLDFNLNLGHLKNLEVLDLSNTSTNKYRNLKLRKPTHVFLRDSVLRFHKFFFGINEQRTISKAVEFHIIYDVEHTGFDRFIYEFERIDDFISKIQTSSTRQFEMLHAIEYIRENIDRLKGSHNSKSSDELLHELVDVATGNHLSTDDFKDDSQNLKQLLRLLVRLKILFPTTQMNDREVSKTTQKNKQPLFIKSKQNVVEPDGEIANLQPTYQILSRPQKNCLLCFSAFPCNEEEREKNTKVLKKSLVIKKSILIYWWVSEGFLEANNFQDSGKQMVEDLIEKGFIEPVIKESRKSASFRMHHHVHSFVTAQAKSESFFDFSREKSKWLGPYVTRSKKDCHQKTQDNFPACAKLWANHKNSPRELESLRNVLTLFNANGSVIDIKPEWFSKMEQLSTLSLGCWGCSQNAKNIEIVDQKFLEELKSMKKLRLISLQGLMNIMKLPESICKLRNLIVLDLRECGYLEELPTGIGSLKNLIHLDLTDCVVLNKIPKGISLLSKLEVLRGFKITESLQEKTMTGCLSAIHDKDNEVCTLRDLSNLEKLYKLSLVVKIKEFPSKGDLEVLTGMKCLRKLKILWEIKESIDSNNASGSNNSTQQHFSMHLDNDWELEKLELWCIPYKFPLLWLFSVKLEKFYIVGGDLIDLRRMKGEGPKTLRLKHLQKMRDIGHNYLRLRFDGLIYMEIKECSFCSNSIWWNDGECIWDLPRDSFPGVFFID